MEKKNLKKNLLYGYPLLKKERKFFIYYSYWCGLMEKICDVHRRAGLETGDEKENQL